MKLIKRISERKDHKGRPFVDYYLTWEYQGHLYSVRIDACFSRDYKKLFAVATEVPQGEPFVKYCA